MIKNKNVDPAAAISLTKIAMTSVTGDVTSSAAGVTTIGAGKVTEAMHVANSETGTVVANTANANVIGGIPVVHMFSIANAASADYDIVLTHKTKVLYAIVVKTSTTAGANANTVQVKNGASAITDAISINAAADQTIKLPATLDDSTQIISAAGTLRVSIVRAGGDAAVDVYVIGVRSA